MTLPKEIQSSDPELMPLIEKVSAGQRLDFNDGTILEQTSDIHTVCGLANAVREKLHADRVGYIVNVHVNYTNVCVSRCTFCAFSRSENAEDAYALTPDEVVERVSSISGGVDEIHLVGGVNPDLRLDYFVQVLSLLHRAFPDTTLKAFTAVELHALASREGLKVSEVLKKLKNAGLGMIPGGGAEIFSTEIREKICPNKATAQEWLDVHRSAHELGIPTNTTMLHGHIEKPEHRVEHLLKLRELQDETGGIIAHIPLPYLRGSNQLADSAGPPSGSLDIRQIALARLILDNVPHIKAYWRAFGIRIAQVGLTAGADDLDGTVELEDIMHEAGSDAPRGLNAERLEEIIKEAGYQPCRRDAFHNELREVCM